MKIGDSSPLHKPGATTKKKSASSTSSSDGFFELLSANEVESANAPTTVSDIQPVTSMDALLSLQEMPEDEIKKRKALQDSHFTLETLETLRHGLLTGNIPEHLLKTLHRAISAQKQQVDDPRLMSIIEDIELRAAVELAKLERASKPQS